MTRQTTKHFLCSFGFNTDLSVQRYNSGWSLSEIEAGKEFIEDGYKQEVKSFRKTIIIKK